MSKKILIEKKSGHVDVPARLREMNRKQRHAVLATASGTKPYTSLIAFAMAPDARSIVFATPKKSQKYRNMVKNRNVSMLIHTAENISKDYASAEAITVQGKAGILRSSIKRAEFAGIFLKKHSALKDFIASATTVLVAVQIEHCLHVGRFQEVTEWHCS
jgi:nitroimidazol reductase NimA-like FMN-containing flavoprotein (pyridoxamine 5'-phosphate oxidase superfamily)